MKMSCKAIIICIQSFCNINIFSRLSSPRLQQLSTLLESKELFSDSTTRSLSLSTSVTLLHYSQDISGHESLLIRSIEKNSAA